MYLHVLPKKCVKYSVPSLSNETQSCITDKLITHSVHGSFTKYVKQYLLNNYTYICNIENCFICMS